MLTDNFAEGAITMEMIYNNLTNRQKVYVDAIRTNAPDLNIDTTKTEYSRAELRQISMKMKGKIWIPNWITHDQSRRVARGVFLIPEVVIDPLEDTDVLAVSPGEHTEDDGEMDFIEDDPMVNVDEQAYQEIM
mgnify:CR=1 FL=1|jgi:hypothetical protein